MILLKAMNWIQKGMKNSKKRRNTKELKKELREEYEEKAATLELQFAELYDRRVTGIAVGGKKGYYTLSTGPYCMATATGLSHKGVKEEDYEEVAAYKPNLENLEQKLLSWILHWIKLSKTSV